MPEFYQKEGMVLCPKLSLPTEHCNELSYDDIGRHPVGSGGMIRVVDINPILLDFQTCDRSLRNIGCGPIKEVQEECFAERVFH